LFSCVTEGRGRFAPAALLFAVLALVLCLPVLPVPILLLLLLILWVSFVRSSWRTFLRLRFLLLATLVSHAWLGSGVFLWPVSWSPKLQGLQQGAHTVLLLYLSMLLLAVSLGRWSQPTRVMALAGLMWPLARLGFPVQTLLCRMVLMLDAFESLPRKLAWSEWKHFWLRLKEPASPQILEVHLPACSRLDYVVCFLCLLLLLIRMMW
jgi:hypothetical protein